MVDILFPKDFRNCGMDFADGLGLVDETIAIVDEDEQRAFRECVLGLDRLATRQVGPNDGHLLATRGRYDHQQEPSSDLTSRGDLAI